MGDDVDAHLGRRLDISRDRVEPAVARGGLTQHDVFGVHSYGLEYNSVPVAVVLHALHVIEVPGAFGRSFADLGSEVPGAMTHVEFQVRLPRDVGSGAACHIVVITADMHQGIFPGTLRCLRRKWGHRVGYTSADDAASQCFAEVSAFHVTYPPFACS